MSYLSDKLFPYPLPKVDPLWPSLHSGELGRLGDDIRKNGDWDRLSIVADMLEEGGCVDYFILSHLRAPHEGHSRACWYLKECWLLNHILAKPQTIIATFPRHANEDMQEAVVVNPGDESGATWLVFVEDCFDPPMYIVEARNVSDAIDIFIDSEYGKSERITAADVWHNKDYGYYCRPGDQMGAKHITEEGWYDLRLNFLGFGQEFERPEPHITGSGNLFNGENMQVVGQEVFQTQLGRMMPFPCMYHGPGLPMDGVSPLQYHYRTTCKWCDKEFFPHLQQDYCSLACYHEDNGEE